MADIEYFEDDGPRRYADSAVPAPSRMGLVVNWAGAIVSLGLVVGMGVWAFQLTMRDVSGVPVIRALEGPMRNQPVNPGGTQAAHQGLAVNRIAEGQEAAPGPDMIVLAPPPVDLEEIDLASASTPELASETTTAMAAQTGASTDTQALIERLIMGAEPLDPVSGAVSGAEAEITALERGAPPTGADVISATIPGPRQSPRPLGRPADLRVVSAALQTATSDVAAAAASADAGELDPDTLPEGTRLVQLGAFDDLATARSEWARLSRQFPDFFNGRARVVQDAVSGGRPFVRLRAHGFDDLADARRFCTALLAQGAACIPVTVR